MIVFTESGYEVQKTVSPVAVKFDVHLFYFGFGTGNTLY